GQLRGRVIDAGALALGRLGHGRRFTTYRAVGEKASGPEPFQLTDGFLENVPQDLDVDLVPKVVAADRVEKVGPLVVELEFIDLRFVSEQAAVVAGLQVEVFMPLVNGLEEQQEILPAWVLHPAKPRNLGIGLGDALVRQQVALLAKSDEDDAVEYLLGNVQR